MALWLRKLRRLGRDLRAFITAPWQRRKLALEAGWELIRARFQTLRATKKYIVDLGELGKEPMTAATDQVTEAQEIGEIVRRAAKLAPFRAVCLQQAIAVRRMLNRRDIPSTVYLGLSQGEEDSTAGQADRDAHAWVMAGSSVVAGDRDLHRFAVVATFG
ncbi:MAG: lasso peptide biosynthesis B2 protein [Pseudomonadota bacterium]